MTDTETGRIKNLIYALEHAGSDEVVFTALQNVPTDNLEVMIQMITSILLHRRLKHGESH